MTKLFFDAVKALEENMQTQLEDVVKAASILTLALAPLISSEHIQILVQDISADSTIFFIST